RRDLLSVPTRRSSDLEVTEAVKVGDQIIVDGSAGDVIVEPSEKEIKAYEEKAAKVEEEKAELLKLVDEPSKTMDGVEVELAANIDRKSTRLNSSHVSI